MASVAHESSLEEPASSGLTQSAPRKAVRLNSWVWGVSKSLAAPIMVTLGEENACSGVFTFRPQRSILVLVNPSDAKGLFLYFFFFLVVGLGYSGFPCRTVRGKDQLISGINQHLEKGPCISGGMQFTA